MNESSKTVAFVVTAAILGLAAGWSQWMTKPKEVTGFEKVGEEFFPEFQDGTLAASLMVTAYDAENDGLREFSVMKKDGLWRIPSHHDYPAEAAERLASTATSLIGVQRESIVERRANKHAEYGVVDPADEAADADSAGKRITLRDEAGDIIADYIIGKPAGNAADKDQKMVRDIARQSDYFFVRVPDEKETYKAKLSIDLSTRFSDWINTDLLKLEADDVSRLEIDNYELNEQDVQAGNQIMTQMVRKVIDQQRLTRDGLQPWQLEGINEATEQLDELQVESLLTLLDSMKIVGVRPKLKLDGQLLVKSDLSVNEELARKDPRLFQSRVAALQMDLERKGFTIGQTSEEPQSIALMASRGELRAATNNGVLYTLYFGRSVSGDLNEIEIGGSDDDDSTDQGDGSDQQSDQSGQDQSEAAESGESIAANSTAEAEATPENRSRYVAIRVDFDESALGEPPMKPTEPTAPEPPEGFDEWKKQREKELEEAAQKESGGESEQTDNDEKSSTESGDESPPTEPEDIAAANEKAFKDHQQALKDFEQAEIQYTTDLELYETRVVEYEGRQKEGKELVEELNERFAEWFYVVPAESLAKLKLTRSDLVKPREVTPPNLQSPISPGGNRLPAAPNIRMPGQETPAGEPDAGKQASESPDPEVDDVEKPKQSPAKDNGEKAKAETASESDKDAAKEEPVEESETKTEGSEDNKSEANKKDKGDDK